MSSRTIEMLALAGAAGFAIYTVSQARRAAKGSDGSAHQKGDKCADGGPCLPRGGPRQQVTLPNVVEAGNGSMKLQTGPTQRQSAPQQKEVTGLQYAQKIGTMMVESTWENCTGQNKESSVMGLTECATLATSYGTGLAVAGGAAALLDSQVRENYGGRPLLSDNPVYHDVMNTVTLGRDGPGSYHGMVTRGTDKLFGKHHPMDLSHPDQAAVEVLHSAMDISGTIGATAIGEVVTGPIADAVTLSADLGQVAEQKFLSWFG